MKTNDQKLQILLSNQKINKFVNEALDWYFTTDFEPAQIGPYHSYGNFKGRSRDQLITNAIDWWVQFGSKVCISCANEQRIHLFEGTSQCLSLWFDNVWIMYEIPHDEEVSQLFNNLGWRLQREDRYTSMGNVTLFRLAK